MLQLIKHNRDSLLKFNEKIAFFKFRKVYFDENVFFIIFYFPFSLYTAHISIKAG